MEMIEEITGFELYDGELVAVTKSGRTFVYENWEGGDEVFLREVTEDEELLNVRTGEWI